MFRDLKEYQEIAKIYADKVSKPENLEERVRGGGIMGSIKPFNKPTGGTNRRAEMSLKRREMQNKPKPETDSTGKVIPSTAQIRADAAAKRGGTPAIGGGNAGASTDSGGTSQSTIKSVPVEKSKPEVSTMTRQGKPRTKAQMMAAKRIAAGKTIDDVKQSNQDAMRARAKAKFAAFKARRAEKKLDKQRDFDDPDKRMNRGESYIPDSNIDEGAKKIIKTAMKAGELIRQGVRKAGQQGGSIKPKKGFYNVKSGPNTPSYLGLERPATGGKRTVRASYGKKPEKSLTQRMKDKYKAETGKDYPTTQKKPPEGKYTGGGDQGSGIYADDSGRTSLGAKYGDDPIKVSGPDQGEPKIGKVTTYKKDPKTGKITKSKPKRDKDAEMYGQGFNPYSMFDHYEYDAYDIVLEYLLSTEQVDTIEEANYVMTEMDAETIQGIVNEGLGSAIKKVGKTVGDTVKKGIKKLKGSELKGDFPAKSGEYTA